jgi:hypothetical protein
LQYGGLSAFLETFVLNQSLGIFSNFGAENPPHRQAAETLCAMQPKNRRRTILIK